MMKKFLTLFLVLAMASVASAVSLDFAVNGQSYVGQDVAGSDIITLTLMDDRGEAFLVGALASSTINVSIGDEYSHTYFAAPSIGGWTFTAEGDGYTSIGAGTWFGVKLPADGAVFTHEFHVPFGLEFSTEIIVDYDINYSIAGGDIAGQEILHVVPEPMTLGLLGLGGLFLRRRKK